MKCKTTTDLAKAFFISLLSFMMIFSFIACSDGDDEKTENPPVSGVATSGTVSLDSVNTTGAQTTATLKINDNNYYEFIENAVVNQIISARSAAGGDTTKTGNWKYFENKKLKYSGTYSGDISKISKEEIKLELTIEKISDSSDNMVEVAAKKHFDFTATTTAFTATIPEVTAKKNAETVVPDEDGKTSYITVKNPTSTGGTVSCYWGSQAVGKSVEFTVTTNTGYEVKEIVVTDRIYIGIKIYRSFTIISCHIE